jgi:hypothetical protein
MQGWDSIKGLKEDVSVNLNRDVYHHYYATLLLFFIIQSDRIMYNAREAAHT